MSGLGVKIPSDCLQSQIGTFAFICIFSVTGLVSPAGGSDTLNSQLKKLEGEKHVEQEDQYRIFFFLWLPHKASFNHF